MRTIIIDGRDMTTREDAHSHLAKTLSLPYYYGKNLDALHDCLTDISEPTHIIVTHCSTIMRALGAYGLSILKVLNNSSKENNSLMASFHVDNETHKEGFSNS